MRLIGVVALLQVQEIHRPFFCLDLSYAHTLLTEGFDIPETTTVTLVKKVSRSPPPTAVMAACTVLSGEGRVGNKLQDTRAGKGLI